MAGCGVALYVTLSKYINYTFILLSAPPIVRAVNYAISSQLSMLIYFTFKVIISSMSTSTAQLLPNHYGGGVSMTVMNEQSGRVEGRRIEQEH